MKKFLAVFFCALVMMAAFPVFASAADVPVAASVNAASSSTDLTSILSSLSSLFTGSTDISKLMTSMSELFTTFFSALSKVVDWSSVASSLWTAIKSSFTDISTTLQYLFAELYGG